MSRPERITTHYEQFLRRLLVYIDLESSRTVKVIFTLETGVGLDRVQVVLGGCAQAAAIFTSS